MDNDTAIPGTWQLTEAKSPNLPHPVIIIAAKDLPYLPTDNGRQNLSIYLPVTAANTKFVGQPVTFLPQWRAQSKSPQYHVHIHGGAWRDPNLTSASVEPAVAHAFLHSFQAQQSAIDAIISLNYTISPYPTHPTHPYDPVKNQNSDPSREAVHPAHVRDVFCGFELLRALGLTDGSFILSGHSAGACLAFQSTLQLPSYYGLERILPPPVPAAVLGMNGLYDLPDLVHNLGSSHEHLSKEYEMFQGIAFGIDQKKWSAASPARFDVMQLQKRATTGLLPPLVVIDQSKEDHLVPMTQADKFAEHLKRISDLKVVRGDGLTGRHAAPWEEGNMLWQAVRKVLVVLEIDK